MPRKKATKATTKIEGDYWVSSLDGQTYKDQKIDATVIKNALKNPYLAGTLWQQQLMVFQKGPSIDVIDLEGDTGDASNNRVLEKLNTAVKRMAAAVDMESSLMLCWQDQTSWGPHIVNDYWDWEGNEIVLKQLTRLDPWSFRYPGRTYARVANPILPGILVNNQKEIEIWQTQSDGTIQQLESVTMLTNPLTPELGGRPLIEPLIPITRMLSTAWQAQMQQVNILGAGGIFFVKVANASADDLTYATNLVKNTGRQTRSVLRENMTVENLGVSTTATSIETINALDRFLTQFWSPSKFISKDGTLIGGSSGPEFDLYIAYIRSMQTPPEVGYARIFQKYLDANGYDPRYQVGITIPEPEPNRSDLFLKIAAEFTDRGLIFTNEARALAVKAGATDLKPLTDQDLALLAEENATRPQRQIGTPLQAQALTAAQVPPPVKTVEEEIEDDLIDATETAKRAAIAALKKERKV